MKPFSKIKEPLSYKLEVIDRKVDYINRGGCAVFALELYRFLERLGYAPTITVLSHNPEGILEAANNNSKRVFQINHVVVRVGNHYLDSEGVYTTGDLMSEWAGRKMVHKISPDVVQLWVDNTVNWNDTFDRSQIPTIKSYFNKLTL